MIDLTKESNPEQVAIYATNLAAVITTIEGAADDLSQARTKSLAGSGGLTAASLSDALSAKIKQLDDLVKNLGLYKEALATFADGMRPVYGRLDGIYEAAVSGGLPVGSNQIYPPDPSDTAKVTLYNQLASNARLDRISETKVHTTFGSDCSKLSTVLADFLTKFGMAFVPPAGLKIAPWLISRGLNTVAGIKWSGVSLNYQFNPRWPAKTFINGKNVGGRFRTVSEMGWLEKIRAKTVLKNYKPKAYTANATATKVTKGLEKAAPALKWVGRAGTVVTAGLTAWDQYQKDSQNPSMGEAEKITRATTKTVSTVGTAMLAAKGGAALGAAIGTVGGPIGVAIGGIAGGIIGGIAGSCVGEAIGDFANDVISSLKFW